MRKKFIINRIIEHKNYFAKEEFSIMLDNKDTIIKIYSIGYLDSEKMQKRKLKK